jgi:protein-tyrosine phosphatase
MALVRKVALPNNASGQLFLHSMPGRKEKIDECWKEIKSVPVHSIICLASDQEISHKSPVYSVAISTGTVPCERRSLPIEDFGTPENEGDFLQLCSDIAESLKSGKNVLVHCGAGIGRSGVCAVLVLMRLRVPLEEALKHVKAAGSGPETAAQHEFLERMRPNTDG